MGAAGQITFAINGDASGMGGSLAQAMAQLQTFERGTNDINKRALTASDLKSKARVISGTVGGLAYNASMFLGPEVSNALYPAVLLGKELKTLSSAMKLTGVGVAGAGVAFVGLLGVVAIVVAAFAAHKAKLAAIASGVQADIIQGNLRGNVLEALFKNRKELGPEKADELSRNIRSTTVATQGPAVREAIDALRGIWTSPEVLAAQSKLSSLTTEGFQKSITDEFAARRNAEDADFREKKRQIAELEKTGDGSNQWLNMVATAYRGVREGHEAEMARIAADEAKSNEPKPPKEIKELPRVELSSLEKMGLILRGGAGGSDPAQTVRQQQLAELRKISGALEKPVPITRN